MTRYGKGASPETLIDHRLLQTLQNYELAIGEEMSKRQSRSIEDYADVVESLARNVAESQRATALELLEYWETLPGFRLPNHDERKATLSSSRLLPDHDQQVECARITARIFVLQCLTRHRW